MEHDDRKWRAFTGPDETIGFLYASLNSIPTIVQSNISFYSKSEPGVQRANSHNQKILLHIE